MKSIFQLRNTVIAALIFFSAATNAQNAPGTQQVAKIITAAPLELPAAAPSANAKDEMVLGGLKLRNEKLHWNFTTTFKGASNIAVFPYAKNTAINCWVDGMRHNILYTNKGRLEHIVRYYNPELLPVAVSSMVTEAFPDYKMVHVSEVTIEGKTAYLINIENKEKLKIIRVTGDDWDVYQAFNKQ